MSCSKVFVDHAEPSLRGAKRRSNPVIVGWRRWPLDCFASLAMTRRVDLIENCSKVPAAIAALSLAAGLAGCFQPLYSESAHPGLVEDLRAIEVAPIPNRIGH